MFERNRCTIGVLAGNFLPFRKLLHISGVVFPFIAYFHGVHLALFLLLLSFLVFILLELVKSRISRSTFAAAIWKSDELDNFALDPLLYFISTMFLLLTSSIYEPTLCYAAIVVLSVGDSVAAVVGFFGRMHHFCYPKTIEGTIAGFMASSVVAFWFAGEIAIVGCAAGMIAEAVWCKYDNIAIPFVSFFAMIVVKTAGLL